MGFFFSAWTPQPWRRKIAWECAVFCTVSFLIGILAAGVAYIFLRSHFSIVIGMIAIMLIMWLMLRKRYRINALDTTIAGLGIALMFGGLTSAPIHNDWGFSLFLALSGAQGALWHYSRGPEPRGWWPHYQRAKLKTDLHPRRN